MLDVTFFVLEAVKDVRRVLEVLEAVLCVPEAVESVLYTLELVTGVQRVRAGSVSAGGCMRDRLDGPKPLSSWKMRYTTVFVNEFDEFHKFRG